MGPSDRHVENARMNPDKTWQVLDPAAGSLPGEIESALGDGDSLSACVTILVDSEIDRDWGARASLAVAKRWAASGRRIILADACLDGPTLHEAVGVENGEGVSDMVLYGASAQRITAHVEGRLMLAPAGTPVTRVADVLEHDKWDVVIRGCREAGATLVFHVSTGTPGAEAMTKRAEGVLVLAPAWRDVEDLLGGESGPLMAVLGPANGDAPSVEGGHEEGDTAAVDVLPPPPGVEDDEEVFAVEALPGLPEEETLGDSATVDPPETSEGFGIADLEGSQYDSGDSLEGGEGGPSTADEFDYAALDSGVPDTADSESGAAVGLGDLDPAFGVPTEPDAEDFPTEVGAEDSPADVGVEDSPADVGFGDSPADVGFGDPPADVDFGDPPADVDFGDSPADVGAEDSPAGVGFEDSPADVGVEDSPAEVGFAEPPADVGVEDAPAEVGVEDSSAAARVEDTPKKEAKKGRKVPRRGGLARLKWQRRRAAFFRLFLIVTVTAGVVGGGLAAAAYYGLVAVPGFTLPERVRSFVPPPVPFVTGRPTPQSEIMTHVLFYDSWRTMADALVIADALRGRLPNLLFFVTPLEVGGTLRFELYVGPAFSEAEAIALREPVAIASDREDPLDWTAKEAPYGFYFGEYRSLVNAQGRVEQLARASIPAYPLQMDYADGTTQVRVYGGAFFDELSAEAMGRMVNGADMGEMILTTRRGTLPE